MLAEEFRAIHRESPEYYDSLLEAYRDDLKKLRTKPYPQLDEEGLQWVTDFNAEAMRRIVSSMHSKSQSALCLSGGGIRSATFALGVLQGFASRHLLAKFHYLSTVSGGGYIGSWLTAWLHHETFKGKHHLSPAEWESRRTEAIEVIQGGLRAAKDPGNLGNPLHPEPRQLEYLREYSNYLSPRLGLLSGDSWTLVAIYLRNLALNWLVIVPWLFVVLLVPRFANQLLLWASNLDPYSTTTKNQSGEFPPGWIHAHLSFAAGWPYYMQFGVAAGGLIMAICYMECHLPRARKSNKCSSQGRFIGWCLVPLFFTGLAFTSLGYWLRPFANLHTSSFYLSTALFGAAEHMIAAFIPLVTAVWTRNTVNNNPDFATDAAKGKNSSAPALSLAVKVRDGIFNLLVNLLARALSGAVGGLVWVWLFNQCIEKVDENAAGFSCLGVGLFFASFLVGMTLFIGLASAIRARAGGHWEVIVTDADREWWARAAGWVLLFGLGWILLTTISLYGPRFLALGIKQISLLGGVSGLVAVLLGFSSKSGGKQEDEPDKPGFLATVTSYAPVVAAPVFLVFLLVLVSMLTTLIIYKFDDYGPSGQYRDSANQFVAAPSPAPLTSLSPAASRTPPASPASISSPTPAVPRISQRIADEEKYGLRQRIDTAEKKIKDDAAQEGITISYQHKLTTVKKEDKEKRTDGIADESGGERKGIYEWWEIESGTTSVPILPPGYSHHDQVLQQESCWILFFMLCAFAALGLASSLFVNINTFSLHGMYRDRLIRAYLAASRLDGNRKPNLFTGFDPEDNLPMFSLWPHEAKPTSLSPAPGPDSTPPSAGLPPDRPLFHVIDATLNLVSGKNLAWQERMGSSFIFTPLHCGSADLDNGWGYRRTIPDCDAGNKTGESRYGGREGVTLGTALTISGAAVNSNWGYHSSPVVTFLLTLFNARLGWWLGNPSRSGDSTGFFSLTQNTYDRWFPKSGISTMFHEAFGLTDETYGYVDLSDGGHFDNMGLYEMVRRRCRLIVLVDAEADGKFTFEGLGMAIRKIRIDFGIDIEFSKNQELFMPANRYESQFDPKADAEKQPRCAVGAIKYSRIDGPAIEDGVLLYIKPVCYGIDGSEPRDVVQYKRSHPTFPHESTVDQFFSESQFESYRALGEYTAQQVMGHDYSSSGVEGLLRDFFPAAKQAPPGQAT